MTFSSAEKGLELVDSVKRVSRETQTRLTVFHDLLIKWQAQINLIAPSTIGEIWSRHIADSMQCATMIEGRSHLIDIGSGAGFPGLVMAFVMAESTGEDQTTKGRIDFIESSGKKCAFLNAVIRETELRKTGLSVHVHHGRIENILGDLPSPDIVSARALAPLDDLLKLTQKSMSRNTIALLPKGRDHQAEIAAAKKHWQFQVHISESRFERDSVILKISDVLPL